CDATARPAGKGGTGACITGRRGRAGGRPGAHAARRLRGPWSSARPCCRCSGSPNDAARRSPAAPPRQRRRQRPRGRRGPTRSACAGARRRARHWRGCSGSRAKATSVAVDADGVDWRTGRGGGAAGGTRGDDARGGGGRREAGSRAAGLHRRRRRQDARLGVHQLDQRGQEPAPK
ncbi:hypothetical protein HK405_002601, partial [Cladochytrium tenue]